MSKKLRTEAVDHLFDAILSLENREECYTFFDMYCSAHFAPSMFNTHHHLQYLCYHFFVFSSILFVNFVSYILSLYYFCIL